MDNFEKIKSFLETLSEDEKDDYIFDLRKDDYNYQINDSCNNSHQLFQDPFYDENDELIYPYIDNGAYKGFYDAGELEGICTIGFDPYNDDSIKAALQNTDDYFAEHLYIVIGNDAECGNDQNELIIKNGTIASIIY